MSPRERAPLELVHSNICGPMQAQIVGGRFYLLTFIDDFIRKTWLIILLRRSLKPLEYSRNLKKWLKCKVGSTSKCSNHIEVENITLKNL